MKSQWSVLPQWNLFDALRILTKSGAGFPAPLCCGHNQTPPVDYSRKLGLRRFQMLIVALLDGGSGWEHHNARFFRSLSL